MAIELPVVQFWSEIIRVISVINGKWISHGKGNWSLLSPLQTAPASFEKLQLLDICCWKKSHVLLVS